MTASLPADQCKHGNSLDHFATTTLLGYGALGRVYEAHCRACNQAFAMKVIDKKLVKSKGLTQKLVNEIDIHQRLKHERILEMKDCFEDDECVYMLLELCRNGELSTFIQSKGALPESEALWLFKQIVEGVKYLHDNNVIHRDLKPSNIMLTDQGNVKIGDFGIAVQLRDISEERDTMCGTANYISPEIVSKIPHGIETDIWSLGCILYALLVGHPPFESPDTQDTILKIKECDFALPDSLSDDMKELLRAMINRNPKQRLTADQILAYPAVQSAVSPSNCSQVLSYLVNPQSRARKQTGSQTPGHVKLKQPVLKPAVSLDNSRRSQLLEDDEDEKEERSLESAAMSRGKERAVKTDEKAVKTFNIELNPRYAKVVRQPARRGKENQDLNSSRSGKKHTGKIDLVCISTERLKPITHTTPHGYIRIDDRGFVEMEIDNKAKLMRIAPTGQKIVLCSKLVEDCSMEYDLASLPHKLQPMYKYASDFVNVLRCKTPKVSLRCTEYRFLLMENEPCHNCELYMNDGTKATHTIGCPTMDILTNDGRRIRVDHLADYEYLSSETRLVIDSLFAALKRCLEAEEAAKAGGAKVAFPLAITPETNIAELFNQH